MTVHRVNVSQKRDIEPAIEPPTCTCVCTILGAGLCCLYIDSPLSWLFFCDRSLSK